MSWKVPKIWNEKTTCYIIGGGPSIKNTDLTILKHEHIIAVNNSYQLVPWADFMFFMDRGWIIQHRENLLSFNGIKVTILVNYLDWCIGLKRVKFIKRGPRNGFSHHNSTLNHGGNSGFCAVNLAALLGAGRIILVGFDMKVVNGNHNYHNDHPRKIADNIYQEEYIRPFSSLIRTEKNNYQILNATPDSDLKCFDYINLGDSLC